jgi:beta-glucosidase
MRRFLKTIVGVISGLILSCTVSLAQTKPLPYQNPKLPVEKRVQDLLSRMTLHEKILQLQHVHDPSLNDYEKPFNGNSYGCVGNIRLSAGEAAATYYAIQKYLKEKTRLGIPVLTVTESLHGAVQDSCTIYPQAIGLGSTFNPDLVNRMTLAIAQELKAMGIKQVLSPDLDIARELRWGRVEETYGEDPFLNGTMGVAYLDGFNQNRIICTPKHFVAHGTPTGGLNLSSVKGGERELKSIYMQPFEKVIREAKPLSIMNCYSSYDGEPVVASPSLMTRLLRNELGFNGYVYSDWGSIEMQIDFLGTAKDETDAAIQAIKAGIDLEASGNCYLKLEKAVEDKKIDIKYINQAVSRVLYVKFTSGLFDNPYGETARLKSAIHSNESIELAREIASESIVLLKNQDNILPLSTERFKKIALIGPSADKVQFGGYSWTRSNDFGVTALQGVKKLVGDKAEVSYAQGCDWYSQNKDGFKAALELAKQSDIAVIVVGTQAASIARDYSNATIGEGFDLTDTDLPGVQEEFIRELKSAGKPLIVVLLTGKPHSISWEKENADAIVVQWFGGEQQGNALADVLFGKVNPSGKLNVSFPQTVGHLPCYYNYLPSDKGYYKNPGSIRKTGNDYVFSNPDALYSFGHGLSYTTFEYQDVTLSQEKPKSNDTLLIDVKVKNTGSRDGKEVVQLYVRDVVSSVVTPVKQLKGFNKVLIKAGETVNVRLILPINELFLYNQEMKRVVEPGEFRLMIGSSSEDIRLKKNIWVVK